MILFGTVYLLDEILNDGNLKNCSNLAVFNLTGMREGLQLLEILPPVEQLFSQDLNERTSDQDIMNYIFYNDNVFLEFFSKVMYPVYSGVDVMIVITEGGAFDFITESIMKLIQQRYEYTPIRANVLSDLDYIDRSVNFGVRGIYNFDQDKQRYVALGSATFGVPNPNPDVEDNDNLLRY
jgi:hypothetical protein